MSQHKVATRPFGHLLDRIRSTRVSALLKGESTPAVIAGQRVGKFLWKNSEWIA